MLLTELTTPRPSPMMLRQRIMQRARRRRFAEMAVRWVIAVGYILAGFGTAVFTVIALVHLLAGLVP